MSVDQFLDFFHFLSAISSYFCPKIYPQLLIASWQYTFASVLYSYIHSAAGSLLAMWGGSGIVCYLSKKRRGFLSGEICTWWHCWSIWINLVENLATFWYWGRQEMYLQDIRQSLKMFKKLQYQDSIKYDLIFSLSVPLVLYLSRLLWTMLTAS